MYDFPRCTITTIVSAVLFIIGFQVWMLGIIADLISVNRRLGEEVLYRTKKQETPPRDEVAAVSRKGLKGPLSPEEAASRPSPLLGATAQSRRHVKSRTGDH